MTFSDEELIPISALQHFSFCPRQCALIHLEGHWAENVKTAEGRALHDTVDSPGVYYVGSVRAVRSLRLSSSELGITGVADVVEFRRSSIGVMLPGLAGFWSPAPVEYKRGSAKVSDCDRVQLCAQALCLEEMLSIKIDMGYIFYGECRRREEVNFDSSLRSKTMDIIRQLHELFKAGVTPRAVYRSGCRSCSLVGICLPQTVGSAKSVSSYMKRALRDSDIEVDE